MLWRTACLVYRWRAFGNWPQRQSRTRACSSPSLEHLKAGVLQFATASLSVNTRQAYPSAMGHKAVRCDSCDMWIHNECSFIAETQYEIVNNTNCTWICPKCEFFNFSDSFFGEQVNLETENRFVPLTKEKKNRSSPCGTNKSSFISGLKFISMNINSIRGKKLELLAFLDFHLPHVVAIQETKIDSSVETSELFPEICPYSVYRKDRNIHSGGVMLLVHKDISHMPITELENDSESIWVKVFANKILILWQVGIDRLVALVKNSNYLENSLITLRLIIRVKSYPQPMS